MKKLFYPLVLFGMALSFSCQSPNSEFEDHTSASAITNLSSFFTSGKKEQLDPVEYMKWVEDKDNGLTAASEVGKYTYSAFYKPLNYVVLKGWKETAVEPVKFKKESEEYSGLQYYTFIIERNDNSKQELLRYDLKDNQDYFARIEYYSFQVQNDLRLVEGKDTLLCRMAHFERAYGLQPKVKIVLGFDRKPEELNKPEAYKNDKTILFYDRVFDAGIIKLHIDKETLNNIPELKIG